MGLSNMANTIAVLAGKLSAASIRAAGLGLGSNLPGKVSRRISKSVLSELVKQIRAGILVVSGTNGKSTTCGFLASILKSCRKEIVHNHQGANLITGITAAVLEASNWSGVLKADYGLFETDEATLPLLAKEVGIKTVAVTNLFRDQLDRFGELDTTARLIAAGITTSGAQAILNADDPNVAQLVPQSQRFFFGIDSIEHTPVAQADKSSNIVVKANTSELAICNNCHEEVHYDFITFGQLGHYACRKCSFRRPVPDVSATNVRCTQSGSVFTLKLPYGEANIALSLPGMFNLYNALAAAAVAAKENISLESIKAGLENYHTLFGRSERILIDGHPALIQLIKNPAGATQAVAAAAADSTGKLLIAINDNYADGRDVSWLWDADFEQLSYRNFPIYVTGLRGYDMAVRLKYAGVPTELILVEPNLEKCLTQAVRSCQSKETLWILPTYTCLLELQRIMRSRGTPLSGT